MQDYFISGKQMKLVYDERAFDVDVQMEYPEKDLQYITVTMTAKGDKALPKLDICWEIDAIDIQAQWHAGARDTKHLMPPWNVSSRSHIAWNAPVYTLHNISGINRVTFAISDCLYPAELYCTIQEGEHSKFPLEVHILPEKYMFTDKYQVTVRVDNRPKHFARCLEDVVAWWESLGYVARDIPEVAREPIYSSWYAFHQDLDTEELIEEARLAREMGCKICLMDDGWCSNEESKGEYHVGDWVPERIPDIRYLADKIRSFDMKFMMWFATPFIGPDSVLWKTLGDMTFKVPTGYQITDFRFPKVRDHITNTIAEKMKEWHLDGFKLDFIDSIPFDTANDPNQGDPRKDTNSLALGIKKLFDELLEKVEKQDKDVLIEFRQAYIGPMMRKYATMFRGFDCPEDSLNNRILTTDIRLISGKTPANSDMFIWSFDEPVEIAALQFANVFFSVPQVSLRISKMPEDQKKMLAFYLKMWTENKELILDGQFTPMNPEANYPALMTEDADGFIAGIYNPVVVNVPDNKKKVIILNANGTENVVINVPKGGKYNTTTYDCMGNVVASGVYESEGLVSLDVPKCGFWVAEAI